MKVPNAPKTPSTVRRVLAALHHLLMVLRPRVKATTRVPDPFLTWRGEYFILAQLHDETVDEMGAEDGAAATASQTGLVHRHAIDQLAAAWATLLASIGYDLRNKVQAVVKALEVDIPAADHAERRVLTALDEVKRTRAQEITLRHRLASEGLTPPSRRALLMLIAVLLSLFLGETAFIATGYQVFGFSDRPLLPFVQLTDELHIAAYSSVAALLVLGHLSGHKLRTVAHDLDRRRRASADAAHAILPRPSRFDIAVIVISVVFAWLMLDSLSSIRADFLHSRGVAANPIPFLAIQAGIFAAAALTSYLHAHPHGHAWATVMREARNAEGQARRAEDGYASHAASVNTNIELLDTYLAHAVHHAHGGAADTRRQIAMYLRRVLLSNPDAAPFVPESAQLTPIVDPTIDLTNALTGTAALPRYEKRYGEPIRKHHDEVRTFLLELDEGLTESHTRTLSVTDDYDQTGELR